MSSRSTFTEAPGGRAALLALTFLVCAMLPGVASAQSLWERLVMPGPLTASHAKLEKECSNCHLSFSQGAQDELCLDCHKETAADILQKSGYHGRSTEVATLGCNHCHTDHEGRDFKIIDLNPEVFDHLLTDFALTGAHAVAACSQCHTEGKPHRTTPKDCVACHLEDEPHKGALGKQCSDCHLSTTWSEVKPFDHSKTDFPLSGRHKEQTCASCHRGENYTGLPKACVGCHTIQDVHADRFGGKCETCHEETGWNKVRFDHDKDAKFALTGLHSNAGCNDCHTANVQTTPPGKDCFACHAGDDAHKSQLGKLCEQCHTTAGWRRDVAFDHDITTFPLIGQHVLVPCEQCHLDRTFHSVQKDCSSCHSTDDKHKGGLGSDCSTCHTPNAWNRWLFDHDRQTDFDLTGKHAGLICSACHLQGTVPDKTSKDCNACHERDDVHRGRFGTQCAACHSSESFKNARLK